MLVREIAARYLADLGTIRIDADERELGDIGLAGPTAELAVAEPRAGDVVLLAVDAGLHGIPDIGGLDLAERLSRVGVPGTVAVLLLTSPVADLPVARIAQAAQVAGLAFVELAPIEPPGTIRTAVVCRPSATQVAVRTYLGDDDSFDHAGIDLDAQGLRIAWEWGLSDARTRALEVRQLAGAKQIGELTIELAGLRNEVAGARERAARAEGRAVAEAQRRGALQQSPSFLVGRALLAVRRHPIQGSRQLLGAIRRGIRR
jgi:hypothetical protein